VKRVTEPYRSEVVGGKGSVFYRAHSYHTKVPPEGIVRMIEHYTEPGAVVVDPFCGSGMTGVACLLAGRTGVLSDLSPAAVHIASGYAAAGQAHGFAAGAAALMAGLAQLETELYGTRCTHCSGAARIEYTVWSDTLKCPSCAHRILFWDAARQPDGTLAKTLRCPNCAASFRKGDAAIVGQEPVLVSVSCPHCRSRDQRPPTKRERAGALRPRRSDISDWYPTAPFESWREMWRGQHRNLGIHTAADFFTDRNLTALAAVWRIANESPHAELLRFAVTAVVNRASRRYQWNPKRPTNVLSGTLYVASLTYEFNVCSLLRRKLAAVGRLVDALAQAPGNATVVPASAAGLHHIDSGSVDYVFTDPPFGANIYYSDASFLWESWLDDFTPTADEAVVSTSLPAEHGAKTLQDYEKLMSTSFSEVARVLKPQAWASVMFHNSDDAVWSALERALESADLRLESAVAFDKTQPSFKGIKQITDQERVSSFDLVLHLRTARSRRKRATNANELPPEALVAAIGAHLESAPSRRRTTPYVHSFVMRMLLEGGHPLTGYSYRDVETLLGAHFLIVDGAWTPRGTP
jgi:16S rRNA G966 N2-methylase RsmD